MDDKPTWSGKFQKRSRPDGNAANQTPMEEWHDNAEASTSRNTNAVNSEHGKDNTIGVRSHDIAKSEQQVISSMHTSAIEQSATVMLPEMPVNESPALSHAKRFPKRSYRTRTVDSSSSSSSSPIRDTTTETNAGAITTAETESESQSSVGTQTIQLQRTESNSASNMGFDVPINDVDSVGMEDFNAEDEDTEYNEDSDSDIHEYNDELNLPEDLEAYNEVLNKPKPKYTWNAIHELMLREHGMDRNGGTLISGISYGFNNRFYSSRHVIERMKLSQCLRKHHGCVNCLNFSRCGDLLCSGSDDPRIIIWNWSRNEKKHIFLSGHTDNIFQTKFVDSAGCIDIVSAARDGQVRRAVLPPSGGVVHSSCLYKHRLAVHKLVICPQSRTQIISVGEDGYIRSKDLRTDDKVVDMLKVLSCAKRNRRVQLFSVSHHPYAPEICVCGDDSLVRVYDKRSMKTTIHEMCPDHLSKAITPQVTCCMYDTTGTEILASYSDENIYLFNNTVYKSGEYMHRYRGHHNHRTIKGVTFFGPNSEYVISGSDCGNIFFWDKNTEAILNFKAGDAVGVVNCLEGHPMVPVLATSGLDHNIKIWTPINDSYPLMQSLKMEHCVKRNLRRSVIDEANDFGDRQFQFLIRQFIPQQDSGDMSDDESDVMRLESSSSSNSDSSDRYPDLGGACHTQ